MGYRDSRPGKENDSPGGGWSRSGSKAQNPLDKSILEGSCSWGGEWRIGDLIVLRRWSFKMNS